MKWKVVPTNNVEELLVRLVDEVQGLRADLRAGAESKEPVKPPAPVKKAAAQPVAPTTRRDPIERRKAAAKRGAKKKP